MACKSLSEGMKGRWEGGDHKGRGEIQSTMNTVNRAYAWARSHLEINCWATRAPFKQVTKNQPSRGLLKGRSTGITGVVSMIS